MKQGDLVRCTWQPGTSYISDLGYAQPMEYIIKGRFGFLVSEKSKDVWFVYFSEINYVHLLSCNAFEVVSKV